MKTPLGNQGMYIVNTKRVVYPSIDKAKCSNCGICLLYCPVNSVKKNTSVIEIDLSYCKGCGICQEECPKAAITMERELR